LGRIRATPGYFLDLASEEIACRSGILLNDQNIRVITKRHDIHDLQGLRRDGSEMVLRAEDLEMAVLNLRVAIGDLPDAEMGQFVLFKACGELEKKFEDAQRLCNACISVIASRKYLTIGDDAMKEIIEISGAPPTHARELLIAVVRCRRRKRKKYTACLSFTSGFVRLYFTGRNPAPDSERTRP
jgi:hypothetical protein